MTEEITMEKEERLMKIEGGLPKPRVVDLIALLAEGLSVAGPDETVAVTLEQVREGTMNVYVGRRLAATIRESGR